MVQLGVTLLYFILAVVIVNAEYQYSHEVAIEKYLYHVSIRYKGDHICSGSIINKRHILTSSNCVASISATKLVIVAGTKFLDAKGDSYEVQEIIKNCDNNGNGIVLLRTRNNINFNENVQSIEVSDYEVDMPGYPVTLTAWKKLQSGEPMAHKLQVFNYRIYSLSECKEKYNHTTDVNLCITKSGSKRICNMDYGGALVSNKVIIGIKLSSDVCVTNCPEVHLGVFKYRYWIQDNSNLTTPLGNKYGHHVSIEYNGEHICSGSIINKRHILTSSNCVASIRPSYLVIVAGITSLQAIGDSYKIQKIITNRDNYMDGIALLRTRNDINFNENVEAMEVSGYNKNLLQHPIFLTTWKKPRTNGPMSNELQVFDYTTYNSYTCRRQYNDIIDINLCIIKSVPECICDMDYGGAIVFDNHIIGIKLFSNVCVCNSSEVHLDVTEYLHWIQYNSDLTPIQDHLMVTTRKSTAETNYQAPEGKYPYHVSIKYDNKHICSGSIINNRHILTSKLCVQSSSPEKLHVVAGTNSREMGGDSYKVIQIIMPDKIQDEVALVRTASQIIFNYRVQSIKIGNCNYQRSEDPIVLTAWEVIHPLNSEHNTDKLHVYDYKIYDQSKCIEKYSYVNQRDICIIKSDAESICDMDLGGPIVAGDYLVGIKVTGQNCVGDEPQVHSRVCHSLPWIIQNSA